MGVFIILVFLKTTQIPSGLKSESRLYLEHFFYITRYSPMLDAPTMLSAPGSTAGAGQPYAEAIAVEGRRISIWGEVHDLSCVISEVCVCTQAQS
jgi:hypothetical protein